MKALSLFALLLIAAAGFAQTAPAPAGATASAPPALTGADFAKVAPEAVIITLNGVCAAPEAKPGDCKTTITRAEFETLMDVLSRQRTGQSWKTVPLQARLQLAMQYSRLLVVANAAEKQNLQGSPEGRELIRFSRLQALMEELTREYQRTAHPGPEEVRKFYDDNPERFTTLALERIQIPVANAQNDSDVAGLRKLAQDLRQRAAQGADFKTLQAEAYQKIAQSDPPEIKVILQPETLLAPAHNVVRQLQPGELSPVVQDQAGFYLYKLDARQKLSFEQEKDEIQELITGQTAQMEIQKLLGSAAPTLNPDYFGPAPQHSMPQPNAE
jgi:hypothetical protein